MKKKALAGIGIVSLGLLTVFGIGVGIQKNIETTPSDLVVNTVNTNDTIQLTKRRNAINANGNEEVTLIATVDSPQSDVEVMWKKTIVGSMGQDNGDRFLAMTISEDSLSATIEFLQPFGNQILVTAYILDPLNPEEPVAASCTFDCYRRSEIDNVGLLVLGEEYGDSDTSTGSFTFNYSYDDVCQDEYVKITNLDSNGVGTISSSVDYKYYLSLSSEFVDLLMENNIGCNNGTSEVSQEFSLLQHLDTMIYAEAEEWYKYVGDVECAFELVIVANTLNESNETIYSSTYKFSFVALNFDDYYTESLSLNHENYIF